MYKHVYTYLYTFNPMLYYITVCDVLLIVHYY